MALCRGVCHRKGWKGYFMTMYEKGYKYCCLCRRSCLADDIFCPCCSTPLRTCRRRKMAARKVHRY